MFAFRSDAADVIKVVTPQPRSPGPSRVVRARPPRRGRTRQQPQPAADAADLVVTSLSRHAEQTGLLVASALAPTTFARSLGPRSAMDQGIVTGIVTGLTYAVTVATQDALAAVANLGEHEPQRGTRRLVLVDVAAIPAGLALGRVLPVRDEESPLRSLVRQAGWRSAVTALGSLLFTGTGWAADQLDTRLGTGGRLRRLPLAVPVGLLVAAGVEWQRRRRLPDVSTDPEEVRASLLASLGIGVGVSTGLAVLAVGEERLASGIDRALARRVPGSEGLWRVVGHGVVLAGVGVAGSALWTRAMQRVESAALTVDPLLAHEADNRWTLDTCSGSGQSLVSWESLGREGRRHVITAVRPEPLETRPPGVPDLSIPTVTGRPAVASPVQVYVGLDAAPTAAERVGLALAEMDRTRAWDRKLIMLVSPTGTGYVNYCAVAATEYLTRGDVATVTLQYSKRPSPLSLGKIAGAREQNRLLWSKIAARVRDLPPERRPRLVLFGESLGAHTSQDVFLHWGTLGLQALGIDRALWVGTPYSSGWMQEVTLSGRDDTDDETLAVVNDIEQFEALPPGRRDAVRYVLLSHDNDGVTKFGSDLIMRPPGWLRQAPAGVQEVDPYSPRGVPASMRWRPVTTFFQLLVDMKNSQVPGAYRASRHDYRPDLTRFINAVYGLGATEQELRTVEDAVARREQAREQILSGVADSSGQAKGDVNSA
jgi:uncharacterized membrane protein